VLEPILTPSSASSCLPGLAEGAYSPRPRHPILPPASRSVRPIQSLACALLAVLGFATATCIAAQSWTAPDSPWELTVGGELEQYLRYLQTTGTVAAYPWTIRGFSPIEGDSLRPQSDAHPWADRFESSQSQESRRVNLLPLLARFSFNSAFPFGDNDGAVWQGRGVTTAVQAGIAGRWGPLSLRFEPIVFRAENRSFDLTPNGQAGVSRFADPRFPDLIDLPQRFGDRAYAKIDPGQSMARVNAMGLAVGISTENQAWGPARENPYLLGNNAAGYPHLFLGSGRPWDLWLFRIHGRIVWGELSQTRYAKDRGGSKRRFTSAIIAVIQPRGFEWLEIGGARFYHERWPINGLRLKDFLRPFEGLTKSTADPSDEGMDPNQLASIFFRLVAPNSGFELYGEYGRDDHSWDARDFLLEPDHTRTYMVGVRKAWLPRPDRLVAFRTEVISSLPLNAVGDRPNGSATYAHEAVPTGHTQLGQVLGSVAAVGAGSGSVAALDAYSKRGRWTATWTRTVRRAWGTSPQTGQPDPASTDVVHALGLERVQFRDRFELTTGVTAAVEFRYREQHRVNYNSTVGITWNGPR
jgi:capsule assembly protein Wzi